MSEQPAADRNREHQDLRAALKARVQRSITSPTQTGRTFDNPERAAEYVVNSLVEYPDGHDLLRRLVAHINGQHAMDIAVVAGRAFRHPSDGES